MIKYVKRKIDGYKSELTFIELSMKIYIMDGCVKKNKPFVRADSEGIVDDYDSSIKPETKMRCYMLKKLIIPGYGAEKKFESDESEETCGFYFGMTYRQVVEYMKEYNFRRNENKIYTLNFYEV